MGRDTLAAELREGFRYQLMALAYGSRYAEDVLQSYLVAKDWSEWCGYPGSQAFGVMASGICHSSVRRG